MSTTITRVSFCLNCSKNNDPTKGQKFLVFGSKGYHVYVAQSHGTAGFTPHILRIHKVIGQNVVYDSACGICDVSFGEVKDGHIDIEVLNWRRGIIFLKNWNDWVGYKHDPDYQI